MARGFPEVQVFFEFLTDLDNPQKRKTIDQQVVHLLDNLDPSGKTNTALELAKIYSWYLQTYTYTPPSDPTDPTDLGSIELKESILPSTNKYQDVMVGVYDENTGEFYTNSAKTTIIPHNANDVYVDTVTNSIWRYDPARLPAGYVRIMGSGGGGGTYVFREGTEPDSFDVSDDGGTSWQSVSIHPTSYIAGDGIAIEDAPQSTIVDITDQNWIQGSIDPSNGTEDDFDDTAIRSTFIKVKANDMIFVSAQDTGSNDLLWQIAFYTEDEQFISMTNQWYTIADGIPEPVKGRKIRVILTRDHTDPFDETGLAACEISIQNKPDTYVIKNTGVTNVALNDRTIQVTKNGVTSNLITFGQDLNIVSGEVNVTDWNRLTLNVET